MQDSPGRSEGQGRRDWNHCMATLPILDRSSNMGINIGMTDKQRETVAKGLQTPTACT